MGGNDELSNILKTMKDDEELVINDYFISLGICKTIEAMGGDLSYESTPAYFEALGFMPEKGQNDYDEFDLSVRKLNQVETMMKAVEIREKKKMADRLEKKKKKKKRTHTDQKTKTRKKNMTLANCKPVQDI